MKLAFVAVSALFTSALALVAEKRQVTEAHLTFHGGPAEYSLTVPTDGTRVETNNAISVSIIDIPDYYPNFCTFETAGEKTLVTSINTTTGAQSLLVGPPQPIIAVTCQGFCVYTYGECYRNGQFVGICCAGFCAANRCRPWIAPK